MTTLANENRRFSYRAFFDHWCIYHVSDDGSYKGIASVSAEDYACQIVALLNHSAMTVNDTLALADEQLSTLKSENDKDCEPKDCAQWDSAVEACREKLREMRVL